MIRRIFVVGAALSAGSLMFGAMEATAASTTAVTKVACTTKVAIGIAPGATLLVPPVDQGVEYGAVRCGKLFGNGVQADAFKVPVSGDVLSKYTLYFPSGTVKGAYHLIPQEGSFTDTNFSAVDYLGKLTVTGGTGAFQGVKGTGTMTCSTPDGIHTRCVDKLKLT